MADLKSAVVRQRIADGLVCPKCPERNMPNRAQLIELDEQGTAYCNGCSASWQVQG